MVIIPEQYFPLLEKAGTKRIYRENEIIFMENDEAAEIYLIESGRVRVYMTSLEGRDATISILKKGRIFGDASFVSGAVRGVNIAAVVPTVIVTIRTGDILPLLHESQELMTLMFQHLTETCSTLTHQVARMIYCNSEQKVADFLLSLSSDGSMTIPFSHGNLAECLGMNRVTVTRVLKKLKEEGAVETGYGTIHILSRDILKQMIPQDSIMNRR